MENRLSATWDAIGPILGDTIRIFVVGPLLGAAIIFSVWISFTAMDLMWLDGGRALTATAATGPSTASSDAFLQEAFTKLYFLLAAISAGALFWRRDGVR